MIQKLKKYFHSFGERPDVWFFYAFLVTNTLSIRKVFYYYPINNSFNEYRGIYLYLSDIFLILTIISWFFILCNKNKLLSIHNTLQKCSTWNIFSKNSTYTVPRGTFAYKKLVYQQIAHNYALVFPFILVIFSFISILWSQSQEIAFFKSVKLFELSFLFFYSYKLFHVEHFIKNSWHIKNIFKIIIAIGLVQSIIGISQFYVQHSLGLTFLKESILSTQLPGVAKIIIDGNAYIRSYGLFPHPNIFGGFLIFSIIVSVIYIKIFNSDINKINNYFYENSSKQLLETRNVYEHKNVPRGTFLNKLTTNKVKIIVLIITLIQVIALLLTFSKSAIIGLLISTFYLYYDKLIMRPQQSVSFSSSNRGIIFSQFKSIYSYKKIVLIIGIIFMLFFVIKPFKNPMIFESLQERVFYLNVSRETFLSDPLLGLGSGQFVINMQNIANIQTWQFQPVHNVFLLILNEVGIILFFMFIFFIYKILAGKSYSINQNNCSTWNIFKKSKKSKNESNTENTSVKPLYTYFKAIVIAFTFVMLFDHYFWDIQQGQILLWMLFGMLANNKKEC